MKIWSSKVFERVEFRAYEIIEVKNCIIQCRNGDRVESEIFVDISSRSKS